MLPGASALSLATAGCNLECKCCQNWEIAQARPEQVPSMTLTPADVVMLAKKKGAPLVACTYTEPVVFSEYVLDIAAAGRAVGVRTVMISNGYIQEQPLADLCREIAAYKVDLKGFDEGFFKRHTGGELKHVLETLRRLRKHGTWTEIVALVIPTQNDSEAETRALARFVRDEVGPETPAPLHALPPVLPPAEPALDAGRPPSSGAASVAMAEGLRFVYLGNVPGHPGENTYCPGCGKVLIRRFGMAVAENRLKGGACPDCHRRIPGHLDLTPVVGDWLRLDGGDRAERRELLPYLRLVPYDHDRLGGRGEDRAPDRADLIGGDRVHLRHELAERLGRQAVHPVRGERAARPSPGSGCAAGRARTGTASRDSSPRRSAGSRPCWSSS